MVRQNILLISHLAINDTNNVGKTLLNIFHAFKKEELCQLFFNPTPPNIDKCNSWYSITDIQILNSIFGAKAGSRIDIGENKTFTDKNSVHKKYAGKTSLKLLARDIIWKIARINYSKLYAWIQEIKPTIIFLAPGYSVFAYRIALKISKKYNIPIAVFLMDDFYHEVKNNSFYEKVRTLWLRHTIKQTLNKASKIYSVSETMAKEYASIFGKEIDVLYTPIQVAENVYQPKIYKNNLRFLYAGSLGLGRYNILKHIGIVLNELYPRSSLSICCSSAYKEELIDLSSIPTIKYEGFVSSKVLSRLMSESDVVLHVESFEAAQALRTRYSVSTKIPECLNSGNFFLAVGPLGQSGLEYLEKNKAAIVCHSIEELDNAIQLLHNSSLDYSEYARNARELLQNNHSTNAIWKKLSKDFTLITEQ